MNTKPNFLITRFTHGSGGKFLSTVLQTSILIDHWSAIVQSQKEKSELIEEVTLQYVMRSFPKEHAMHMQLEPMVPYCTDLYSTGYLRGQDVTIDQYLDYAKKVNDGRLQSCMDKNLIANLIFHKPQIPNFCQDSSVITILNSTNEEKEWVYRTLWAKHFLEINNTIHHLPSDPDYCSFSSLATVLKFQNKYKFDSSERDKIFNEFVVNDHTNEWYDNKDNFTEFDTTNKINNQFINLRDFFDKNTFLLAVSNLFDYFKLGSMNTKLVSSMYDIWWSRQVQL